MGTFNQPAQASWYSNNSQYSNATWASHSTIELTSDYVRPGRIQFNSLSGGNAITDATFQFRKTNTGGGGYFHFYATDNVNLLPSQLSSMIDLGLTPIFGSGAEWKTLTLPSSMFDALSSFAGTWYLVMTCSVYVTFYGNSSTYDPTLSGTYSEGSMWVNDGGTWKLGPAWVNDGGVWKQGTAYVNDGGTWKQGF